MFTKTPYEDTNLVPRVFVPYCEDPGYEVAKTHEGMFARQNNQRSLRDSTILHGVCVGEKMIILKAIYDALTH